MSGFSESGRRMRGLKAALLATAIAFPLTAPAHAISLTEAIDQALSTNPDIGIVASNREAVDEELRQARGLWLPQLDAQAGIGKENTTIASSARNSEFSATRLAADSTRDFSRAIVLSASKPSKMRCCKVSDAS